MHTLTITINGEPILELKADKEGFSAFVEGCESCASERPTRSFAYKSLLAIRDGGAIDPDGEVNGAGEVFWVALTQDFEIKELPGRLIDHIDKNDFSVDFAIGSDNKVHVSIQPGRKLDA
jgi:hypothetical protein